MVVRAGRRGLRIILGARLYLGSWLYIEVFESRVSVQRAGLEAIEGQDIPGIS